MEYYKDIKQEFIERNSSGNNKYKNKYFNDIPKVATLNSKNLVQNQNAMKLNGKIYRFYPEVSDRRRRT